MKTKIAGKSLVRGLLVLTALAGGSLLAFKLIFNRPGEAAINLLPKDCVFVMTLDTHPSERQAVTFNNIKNWLEEEKIGQRFDEAMQGLFKESQVPAKVRPFVEKSFAIGVWMGEDQQPRTAWLISVSKPGEVRDILTTAGKPRSGYAAVIDEYLVFADTEASFERIQKVKDGNLEPVSVLPTFTEARQALPQDANLMLFADARNLSMLMDKDRKQAWDKNIGTGFMALGITLDAEGISFDWNSELESKNPALQKILADSSPLDMAAASQLPIGAYGLVAMHRLDRHFRAMQLSSNEDKEARHKMDDGISTFERETGLTMEEDIMPILQGNHAMAVYPGATAAIEDLDVLWKVSLDDPARITHMIDKLSQAAAKKSRSGKPLVWVRTTVDGATLVTLSPESEREANPRAKVRGGGNASISSGPLRAPGYVELSDGFLFGTSKAILLRGLAASRGTGDLGSNPNFQALLKRNVPNSEGAVIVNLHQVMKSVAKSMRGQQDGPRSGPNPADLEYLFGDEQTALIVSGKYERSTATGRLFVPLDYERAIRLVGEQMRSMNRPRRSVPELR